MKAQSSTVAFVVSPPSFLDVSMSGESDYKAISEDDCIICGKWPENDRWALREMIDTLPLQEVEQICDDCLMAFWQSCVVGPKPDGPSKH